MENNSNIIKDDHLSKPELINENNSLIARKESKSNNEEHILSLRKKKKSRQVDSIRNFSLNPQILNYDININKLIPLIQNDALYIKFNSNCNEIDKINYLLQMLISDNNNILKYSLMELKVYLTNIKDSDEFISKNLTNLFNEKMYKYLFNLLFKNTNNFSTIEEYYQIITILCFIISKLCLLNDFYINILSEFFVGLLNLAQKEQDKNIKNSLYTLTNKILLKENENLEEIYENYFNQVYNELIRLINESINNKNIIIIKNLYPTLVNIINIMISNNICDIDIKKISNLLSLVKQYLDVSFMATEILKSSLYFLINVLKYQKKFIINKGSENDLKKIINSIRLNKHIISYIYEDSAKNDEFRCEIIEMLNNMIMLNDSEFLNDLIDNNICEQISYLQDYLLENNNQSNTIIKSLYKSHIDLIYNLISTQSQNAIQSICIDNSCISNLFLFINNSTFLYSNDNLKIIEIFDLIIQSKGDFVHSLLLSENIYELYKNILDNTKDNNILSIILKDFSIMIEQGKKIKTSNGSNIVSNHFLKNGIIDLINNIKSRSEINNQIIFLLDEITKLLEENNNI